MSMMEAVKSVFSKYATFKGRARRSEYWFFDLFNVLIITVCLIVMMALFGSENDRAGSFVVILLVLYVLAAIIPALAVLCRRLHDTGKSGAYMLFSLIPAVGAILILVWTIQDSDPGDNQYGSNPKRGFTIGPIKKDIPASLISCPSCGKKNEIGTIYCMYCGKSITPAPVTKECVNCHKQVDKYARICPHCGENPDLKKEKKSSGGNPWIQV